MDDPVPYHLIIRSLQGPLSDFEDRQLRRWLDDREENRRAYEEVVAIWALPSTEPPPVQMPAQAVDEVLRRARAAPTPILPSPAPSRGHRWNRWIPAVAAAILLVGVFVFRRPGTAPSADVASTEFVTGAGETVTARLADGSFVRLAPASRLRVFSDPFNRSVWLHGRAFFAVAKDRDHPFSVQTEAGEAVVLGTRFELRADGKALDLIVVEGLVELSAGRGKVAVHESERAQVRGGETPTVEKVDDVYRLVDWPGGVLMFQNTPLRLVARDLERQFRIRLVFADSIAPARRVSALFTGESFAEVLTSVCRATRVGCVVQGDSVMVSR